ncbi:MAG: spermidine/putrescine ABC transporter substrate-binding protein PotF, partial [Geminicoccaceae bacterium]|nr:spermidine/putrescine ABC transporter substrate-binding protein PotF [Geminicoccaceae bacterium]
HALIAYLLKPEVIAAASNYIFYANPNREATPLLSAELRDDPEIYPPPQVRARLFSPSARSEREIRNLNRLWTRLKSGS